MASVIRPKGIDTRASGQKRDQQEHRPAHNIGITKYMKTFYYLILRHLYCLAEDIQFDNLGDFP